MRQCAPKLLTCVSMVQLLFSVWSSRVRPVLNLYLVHLTMCEAKLCTLGLLFTTSDAFSKAHCVFFKALFPLHAIIVQFRSHKHTS